jgi:23S rRNA (uracil1939-C5)-methyltransferase
VKRKHRKITILENVLVTNYAAEGKSLAKVDGKVIFIERCVPGDIVNVQLLKNKTDWAEGFPTKIIAFSKDRVAPICQHFGTCGGCIWQMLPYQKQLEYKQQQVQDNFERIAKVELPTINTIIGATNTTKYRNKLEYTFATKEFIPFDKMPAKVETTQPINVEAETDNSNKSIGAAGFHARGFFDKVVAIDTCHLQEEPTNLIRNAIKNFAIENNYSFYDIRNNVGFLRNMMVRIATTGEWMANVVVGYYDKELIENLMQFILTSFPKITSLLYTVNTKLNDSIFDLEPITYFGKGYIIEKLEEFSFKISPKSFFQTNTKQAEKLYTITRDFAELTGVETVYDLYGGTGSIGIFVSQQAKKIIGVELIEDAVKDAYENAKTNNLQNAQFFVGDVIKICDTNFFETHGKPDVVITDPPRVGMHEKLVNKLLDMEAPIIVYVSCNPATQARDLALLNPKYKVTKVQPVDMFPHTHHIENVVQLKLRTTFLEPIISFDNKK